MGNRWLFFFFVDAPLFSIDGVSRIWPKVYPVSVRQVDRLAYTYLISLVCLV